MQKLLLLNKHHLDITLNRLCQELIENHDDFNDSLLVGMQPRGTLFAQRMGNYLEKILNISIPVGYLDVTFYRDDFRRRESPLLPSKTNMPFLVEDKKVILIDDVLYTGRTVRSALSAIVEFGRPKKMELLVLIDRLYSRDLPIQPNYVGKAVDTISSQRVLVEWTEQGAAEDNIWLINETENTIKA